MKIRVETNSDGVLITLGNREQILVPLVTMSAVGSTAEEACEKLEWLINKDKDSCVNAANNCSDTTVIVLDKTVTNDNGKYTVIARVGIAAWEKEYNE